MNDSRFHSLPSSLAVSSFFFSKSRTSRHLGKEEQENIASVKGGETWQVDLVVQIIVYRSRTVPPASLDLLVEILKSTRTVFSFLESRRLKSGEGALIR